MQIVHKCRLVEPAAAVCLTGENNAHHIKVFDF